MDKSISVSVRGVLIAGLAILALLGAYLLGSAGGVPGTPAQAAEEGDGGRTVTMVGVGTVNAVPDEVSFTVSVGVTRDDLSVALESGNRRMAKVLDALADHGVTKEHMQTTGLRMSPVYDYHSNEPPTLRGYRVSQKARVTVPELKEAGKAINAAVAAGGNRARVNDIALGISDVDSFLADARSAAVDEATTKAEEYAEAAGESLDGVVTLEEVSAPDPNQSMRQRMTALRDTVAADKAVPIRPGEEELEVRVKVVWSLS